MIVIYGQRNCGKVDKVPNLFYVITKFAQIYWLPLIPLGSYIVLEGSETDQGFKGVQTSLSFKSILAGWLRAGLVVGMIACLGAGTNITFDYLEGNRENHELNEVVIPWLILAGCIFFYWLTVRCTFAGRERALWLGEQLGLSAMVVEKFLDPRFQEELRSETSDLDSEDGLERGELGRDV